MSIALTRKELLAAGAHVFDEARFNTLLADASKSIHLPHHDEALLLGTVKDAITKYGEEAASIAATYEKPIAQVYQDIPFALPYIEKNYLSSIGKEMPKIEPVAAKIVLPPTPAKAKLKAQKPLSAAELANQLGVRNSDSKPTFSNLSVEQKASIGLSALLTAFSAIGTLDALSKVKKKDADGTTHIQPTQVGLALLNGLLTAGLGYAAFQQYHGR